MPEFQGVLVFTRNNVYRVTGAENPETVNRIYIPGNHGCVNFRSIAVLNNAPVWLSGSGICIWDGNSIAVPSYRVIHTANARVKFAVAAHDRYFLFLNEQAIVFDRRDGDIFYKLNISCDYAWYDGDTDILYMQIGGTIHQFGQGNPLTVTYLSPYIGGDTESVMKKFREVALCIDGEGEIAVRVDGTEKVRLALPAGRNRVKLPLSAVGRHLDCSVRGICGIQELAVTYD